jgi:hypothetical protein
MVEFFYKGVLIDNIYCHIIIKKLSLYNQRLILEWNFNEEYLLVGKFFSLVSSNCF